MSANEYAAYLDQVYEDIKTELLEKGELFEDDQFPPTNESLVRFEKKPKGIRWKRAKEISKKPKFIIKNGKNNANDLAQGDLDNCWFIAAAAAIASIPEIFNEVVPQNQTFDKGDYCGIFHLGFWRYGECIDVVVDDYLPVDSDDNLIYCGSRSSENEYWCALFEKAYAKLNTCYEFLHWGDATEAMVDLTGGVQETFYLREVSKKKIGRKTEKDPNALWRYLKKAMKFQSICTCAIDEEHKKKIANTGLVLNHVYTITKVAEIYENDASYSNFQSAKSSSFDTNTARLIRLRNPYGDTEFNGKWSDKSDEWNNVSREDKKRIGLVFRDDGEFWMSFEDFLYYFDELQLVHIDLNACFKQVIKEKNKERDWYYEQFYDSWVSEENSGGSDPETDNFWTNPQYTITVTGDTASTLIVGLMQIGSRENRIHRKGEAAEENIMFFLYKVINSAVKDSENDGTPIYTSDELKWIAESDQGAFREVTGRFKINEGTYVIIPCLENEDEESEFLLRYFIDSLED